jgi:hypothetical protein
LRIEAEGAQRWEERVVVLVVAGLCMVSHKAPQTRHDDTVIAQQKNLNMSVQFNHECKSTAFLRDKQIKKLKNEIK